MAQEPQESQELSLVRTMRGIQERQETRIETLESLLSQFVQASEKFIEKVDKGLARSTETYNDLKNLVTISKALNN